METAPAAMGANPASPTVTANKCLQTVPNGTEEVGMWVRGRTTLIEKLHRVLSCFPRNGKEGVCHIWYEGKWVSPSSPAHSVRWERGWMPS